MSRGDATPEVLAEPDGDGWIIKSPLVGIYRNGPEGGDALAAGDPAGRITVLNRIERLRLPAGVSGRVVERLARGRTEAVEYGQTLFTLSPTSQGAPGAAGSAPAGRNAGLPAGCLPVSCPIDGVFYLRPSPGSPPYVQPGARVETGRTLGLIEAMKSFNAVVYGGQGLPARAVVVEVRAADATEVRQGAVLFVVRADADTAGRD